MAYTEAHRVFLTYIRGRKTIPSGELSQAFQTLCSRMDLDVGDDLHASLNSFLSEINVKLEKHNFKVASIRDQSTEENVYVFVNTKFDEAIQGCTNYTPPELDCMKQLIDNIVNSHGFEFSLPFTNSKQHIMGVLKIKGSEAEFFLRRLIDDGWIELSSQNKAVISPTTLAELHGYMVDRFGIFSSADSSGKLLECVVCKQLVTLGRKCANSDCFSAFHSKCHSLYARNQTECPNRACERLLDEIKPVGVQ